MVDLVEADELDLIKIMYNFLGDLLVKFSNYKIDFYNIVSFNILLY